MDYQYKSICRGDHSIAGRVKAAGVDPSKYIFYFNLRVYDRLNATERIEQMEKKSGVRYQDVQHAHATELMGESGATNGKGMGGTNREKDIDEDESKKKQEVMDKKAKFEESGGGGEASEKGEESESKDTVAQDAMQGGGNIKDEKWGGDEESERTNYVTEQLYIHAKVGFQVSNIEKDILTDCRS